MVVNTQLRKNKKARPLVTPGKAVSCRERKCNHRLLKAELRNVFRSRYNMNTEPSSLGPAAGRAQSPPGRQEKRRRSSASERSSRGHLKWLPLGSTTRQAATAFLAGHSLTVMRPFTNGRIEKCIWRPCHLSCIVSTFSRDGASVTGLSALRCRR